MGWLLRWAEAHQAGLIAVGSIVSAMVSIITAVATVLLAWLTFILARGNRLLRKAGTEPEVVAYLMLDERHNLAVNFVLANIGQGPARDVTFSIISDENDFNNHKVRLRNKEKRTATSVLPQGERIVSFFGMGHELYREPRLKSFKAKVTYKDLVSRRRTGEFTLDVSQFDGLISLGTPVEQEISSALNKIARNLGEWSSGFSRLKVETITTEEHERMMREQEEIWSAQAKNEANVASA